MGKAISGGVREGLSNVGYQLSMALRLKIRSSTAYTKTDEYGNQYGDYFFHKENYFYLYYD